MEYSTNLREIALAVLLDVERNHKLAQEALHTMLKRYQYLAKTERAFLSRICEGVVERQIYLDYIINSVSSTKVNKCKPCIRVVLRMAVYQIFFMDSVPDEAACNEAVKLAKKKGFHKLSGFVNGVLRNIVRGKDTIVFPDEKTAPNEYLSVMYSMPMWLVEYLLEWYSYEQVKGMLIAFLENKRTSIRVNRSKTSLSELKEKLIEQGIEVEASPYVEHGLRISEYNYMNRVPGFKAGEFTVQDDSSMLVGQIASPKAGDIVIDVCAAPGGKSLDLADRLLWAEGNMSVDESDVMEKSSGENSDLDCQSGYVISCDVSQEKIDKIQENIDRMQFSNVCTCLWDGRTLNKEWIEKADIVICDVPCSGMGVIGRKQDIKYRLTREQLDKLVVLQREILSNAWQYVKAGGTLLFSTCTVNPKENQENLKWLLDNFPFESDSLNDYIPECLHEESTMNGYLTLLPGKHDTDGFFIARLKRIS